MIPKELLHDLNAIYTGVLELRRWEYNEDLELLLIIFFKDGAERTVRIKVARENEK